MALLILTGCASHSEALRDYTRANADDHSICLDDYTLAKNIYGARTYRNMLYIYTPKWKAMQKFGSTDLGESLVHRAYKDYGAQWGGYRIAEEFAERAYISCLARQGNVRATQFYDKSHRSTYNSAYNSSTYNSTTPSYSVCAENGSCYGDISEATGRPKTVSVKSYYRTDGTYVRGHYRSPPQK